MKIEDVAYLEQRARWHSTYGGIDSKISRISISRDALDAIGGADKIRVTIEAIED